VTVFVSGGSRGIGRAIALRFARDGARRVAIGYLRNDRAAEKTAEELRALGAEAILVRGNITSEAVLQAVAELGPLDVLVHNAATGVIRPALETEDRHWDWTLNANARALLQLVRVAAPQMPDGSSIVAISSLGAQRVLDNYVLIGTSKAALEASSATSQSSLPRAFASTPSRAESSTRVRSITSRTARRCWQPAARTRSAAWWNRATSRAPWPSCARRTPRWSGARR